MASGDEKWSTNTSSAARWRCSRLSPSRAAEDLVGCIALFGTLGLPKGWAILGGGFLAVVLAFLGLAYYVLTR